MNKKYTPETEEVARKLSAAIEHGKHEHLKKTASEAMEYMLDLDEKYQIAEKDSIDWMCNCFYTAFLLIICLIVLLISV